MILLCDEQEEGARVPRVRAGTGLAGGIPATCPMRNGRSSSR
jgi:hypothetical protein